MRSLRLGTPPAGGVEVGAPREVEAGAETDEDSAAKRALAFSKPPLRLAFVGSSLRPRSKADAAASKSPREYCACLQANKQG